MLFSKESYMSKLYLYQRSLYNCRLAGDVPTVVYDAIHEVVSPDSLELPQACLVFEGFRR